jgi:paraquat-inducible protein B
MRANPTVIGAFVIGAVVLGVGGVLLFSGGGFFEEKNYYVMFFEDSVDGLVVGSPVKLEGVKIGEVVDVHVEWDQQAVAFRIPVTIEVVKGGGAQAYGGGELVLAQSSRDIARRLIEKGMRASLATESFITGQLAIVLGFHPDTEAKLVGGKDLPYPEVPTVRSGLSKVMQEIQEIPFKQIALDLQKTIQDIDKRVESEDVTRMINSVADTLEPYRKLGEKLDERIDPLVDNVEATSTEAKEMFRQATETVKSAGDDLHKVSESLDKAIADIDKLVLDVDAEVKPTAEETRKTLEGLRETLRNIDGAAKRVDLLLKDDSPTITELNGALAAFRDAARSIKALADTLQRQPESILRGKAGD